MRKRRRRMLKMTLEQSPLCYDYHLQTFPLLSVSRCHDSVDFCPHLLPPTPSC